MKMVDLKFWYAMPTATNLAQIKPDDKHTAVLTADVLGRHIICGAYMT